MLVPVYNTILFLLSFFMCLIKELMNMKFLIYNTYIIRLMAEEYCRIKLEPTNNTTKFTTALRKPIFPSSPRSLGISLPAVLKPPCVNRKKFRWHFFRDTRVDTSPWYYTRMVRRPFYYDVTNPSPMTSLAIKLRGYLVSKGVEKYTTADSMMGENKRLRGENRGVASP